MHFLEPLIRAAGEKLHTIRDNKSKATRSASFTILLPDYNIFLDNLEMVQKDVYERYGTDSESESESESQSSTSVEEPPRPISEPSPPAVHFTFDECTLSPLGTAWALQLTSHLASPRRPLADDPYPDFLHLQDLPGPSGIALELGVDDDAGSFDGNASRCSGLLPATATSAGTRSFAASFSPSEVGRAGIRKHTTWSTPEAFGDDDGPSPSRPSLDLVAYQ
ncbi:hypothetical protein C8R44DRAFT_879209 [Mycena epipterygia]|nr:hypothetical protein C8R44DRAFT_879209 [Mycena epipterygia]